MKDTVQCLPPEWAPQSAVMLTWPHAHGDWRPLLPAVEPVFAAIAREVSRRERVVIAASDEPHLTHIRGLLQANGTDLGRVRLHTAPSNDTWARDHGPITVLQGGKPLLLDFQFNGWGRKYAYSLDNQITGRLHGQGAFAATPLEGVALVLEGGSIEVDGEGTLLTTTSCLLSPERNPEYDCVGLEGVFAKLFGVHRVLWLEEGELAGDDTDGHIDTLARFCDPRTIAYVSCTDPADEHFDSLRRMEQQLREFRDFSGAPYRLVPLPLPAPRFDPDGRRLPATYANFLIINGAVLVPTYGDPLDAVALERLAGCFPGREIIGIDCLPLIRQYGSLHCVTMQIPAGVVL